MRVKRIEIKFNITNVSKVNYIFAALELAKVTKASKGYV